ncbi:MAG TPA: archaeosortase/exosortase family protein, partial [Pirellulales bacterium]|nr:archaeosortase/exosortase family protein [Pirellulales bacterium]
RDSPALGMSIPDALSLLPAADRSPADSRFTILAPLLILGAQLPLLVADLAQAWTVPHYRFAPALIAALVYLAMGRLRDMPSLAPGSTPWSLVLAAGSILLMTAATLFWSPGLGLVAAMALVLAAGYAVGGGRLVASLLPIWGLGWLAIRPPLGLDLWLWGHIQSAVAALVHRVLDACGVLHGLDGSIVELPGQRLPIDRLCGSSWDLALLALTLVWLVWHRRSLRYALGLVSAALAVIVGINVVIGVALVLLASHGVPVAINSLAAWFVELTGVVLAMLLVFSADQACRLLQRAAGIKYLDRARQRAAAIPVAPQTPLAVESAAAPVTGLILTDESSLVCTVQSAATLPAGDAGAGTQAPASRVLKSGGGANLPWGQTWLASWGVAMICTLIGGVQMAMLVAGASTSPLGATIAALDADPQRLLAAAQAAGWRPIKATDELDESAASPPARHHRWRFQKGPLVAEIVLRDRLGWFDDPRFEYQRHGWLVDAREPSKAASTAARHAASAEEGAVVQVDLRKPSRAEVGRLIFATLDQGAGLPKPGRETFWRAPWQAAADRLAETWAVLGRRASFSDRQPLLVEAFCSAYRARTEEGVPQILDLFERAAAVFAESSPHGREARP